LRAQFVLAQRIETLRVRALSAYTEASSTAARLGKLARNRNSQSMLLRQIRSLAGGPPLQTPDNSAGLPETNVTTLHYIGVALGALQDAVESADVAPTADDVTAYKRWNSMLASALGRWQILKQAAARY
jgi:hypothetical protein